MKKDKNKTIVNRPVPPVLPKVSRLETRRFDETETSEPLERSTGTVDKIASRPWRIGIQVVEADTELIIDLKESIVLGRSYPDTAVFHGVDLAPFEAYHSGVSRRHAVLCVQDDRLMLMDDHSANGTYVAGKRLEPGRLYPVRHGDEVQLGGMRLKFSIIHNTFS
jgi:pSer/pThr/pTyr-binding forkhead associated (FHA) protein